MANTGWSDYEFDRYAFDLTHPWLKNLKAMVQLINGEVKPPHAHYEHFA